MEILTNIQVDYVNNYNVCHSLLSSYYSYVLLALFNMETERANHGGERQCGG